MRFRDRQGKRVPIRRRAGRLAQRDRDRDWEQYGLGYATGCAVAREAIASEKALRLQVRLIQARVTEFFRRPELFEQQRRWAIERGLI